MKVGQILDELLKDQHGFADFEFLSYWQTQFNSIIAFTVFLAWIKVSEKQTTITLLSILPFRFSNMFHSIKLWHNYPQHYHDVQKMFLALVSCSWSSSWHMHNWVIYCLVRWLKITKHFPSRCKRNLCEDLVLYLFEILVSRCFVSSWVILISMVSENELSFGWRELHF